MIPRETRILLADNHRMAREGIRCLLETRDDLRVICEVDDGDGAVCKIESEKPDIAILEFALPHLSAISVIERIAAGRSATRCIILSGRADGQHVRDAVCVGAAGYLLKTAPGNQLFEAIDVVQKGQFYLSPDVSQFVVDAVRDPGQMRSGVLLRLTTREREVLQLIAEGLTTKEISSQLGVSCRTSDSHRARLMRKLDVHKASGLVRLAIREGLVEV